MSVGGEQRVGGRENSQADSSQSTEPCIMLDLRTLRS